MAWAAPLAAVAQAGGALLSGAATSNAADYQGQVAANNAVIAEQNAVYATRAGQVQAQNESMKGAGRQAALKASMAANGVDVNTGSAVDVEAGAREVAVTEANQTMHNAILQAYGYRTQETGFKAQEGLDKTEATTAGIGSDLTATGDILSQAKGIGNMASGITSLFSQ